MTKTTRTLTSFINHSFLPVAKSAHYLPVINPSTGTKLPQVQFQSVTREEISDALEAADAAKEALWDAGIEKRIHWLQQIREKVEENREYLARLDCLDNGKTIAEARSDITESITCFRVYEALGRKHHSMLQGDPEPILNPITNAPDEMFDLERVHVPVGVSVQILPFNYPLTMIAWKLAPALLAGCPMIIKPSENTMLTSYQLATFVQQLEDMPKGSINMIYGEPNTTDFSALTQDSRVRKLAFTGSVSTGKKLATQCASNFIRCSAETGGKAPMIIDASFIESEKDYDKCVEWILTGIVSNKGEICSATSRLIVDKKIYNKLMEKLKQRIDALCIEVTCPDEDANLLFGSEQSGVKEEQTSGRKSELGPIVNEIQYQKVWNYIEKAKSEGCTLLCGGDKSLVPAKGFFVPPTVFRDVKPEHTIWKEEVFGPVLAACSYESPDEALRLATDSWNGLASAVFTKDSEFFNKAQRALRTGTIWLNASQPNFPFVPWGGFGDSGTQGRELGKEGLMEYLEVKAIYKNRDNTTWQTFNEC